MRLRQRRLLTVPTPSPSLLERRESLVGQALLTERVSQVRPIEVDPYHSVERGVVQAQMQVVPQLYAPGSENPEARLPSASACHMGGGCRG